MNNNQTTYQLSHTTHDRPSASSSFNILSVLNPEPSPPSGLGPAPTDHITRTLPSPRQQEPPTRTILPPPSAITQPQYYDPVRYSTSTLQGHGQSQSNSTGFTLLPPPFPLASYPTSPTQSYSSNSHNSSNTQPGYGYPYTYRSPGFNTQTPASFNTTLAPISQISPPVTSPLSMAPPRPEIVNSCNLSPSTAQVTSPTSAQHQYSALNGSVADDANTLLKFANSNKMDIDEKTTYNRSNAQDIPPYSVQTNVTERQVTNEYENSRLAQLLDTALEQERRERELADEENRMIHREREEPRESDPSIKGEHSREESVVGSPSVEEELDIVQDDQEVVVDVTPPRELVENNTVNSLARSVNQFGKHYDYDEPLNDYEDTVEVSTDEVMIFMPKSEGYENGKQVEAMSQDDVNKNVKLEETSPEPSSSGDEFHKSPSSSRRSSISKTVLKKTSIKKPSVRHLSAKKSLKRKSSSSNLHSPSGDDNALRIDPISGSPSLSNTPNSNKKLKKANKQRRKNSQSSSVTASPMIDPIAGNSAGAEPMAVDETQISNKLYCICRSGFDNRFMIQCDGCNEWYHGDCVKISEDISQLIDKYYCPGCTAKGNTSSWKQKCRNPPCNKPARIPSSRYCSQGCGLALAQARLRENEKRAKLMLYLQKPQTPLKPSTPNSDKSTPSSNKRCTRNLAADLDDRSHWKKVQEEWDRVTKFSEVIERREQILRKAIKRCESEGKNGYTPCGFDSRLLLNDKEVMELGDATDENVNICKEKGSCEKHPLWQSVKLVEIEQEKALQSARLEKLRAEKKQIGSRMKRRKTDWESALLNGTINHSARSRMAILVNKADDDDKLTIEETKNSFVDIEA
ncbi:10101_t:CDS:2 [Paraglomus occultum]|uniref:10101_t:CDS:1 n=1 Tax=Paraglomus occultum TaxID=144539 RepID=A0A9N8VMW7_9GLOM|nr:10101_t:CDS:2 [Paraglomus occultum]